MDPRPQPTHWQPEENPVVWARRETWAFTISKCKVYGLPLAINLTLIAFISKGMPGHFLSRFLGLPLVLAIACLFAAFLFYAASAVGEFIDRKTK